MNNIFVVDGFKLFLRIGHPRNKEMGFSLVKDDPIRGDYVSAPYYNLNRRKAKFYGEWLERNKKNKSKAARVAENL